MQLDPKDDVEEGFALFMLCHHFGRRGRAMARSLAWQTGVVGPLHLFAFYSRPEDALLITEGAADGPRPPSLTLFPVPEADALRRGIHYSRAQMMHSLKYTVFCDADLWFPPDFFATYISALEEECRGYWSCRVLDLPREKAEEYVSRWTEIQKEVLQKEATGRRHDASCGHSGHFQCIPRDLAQYPAVPAPRVDQVDLEFATLAIARSDSKRYERRIGKVPLYHFDHPHSWQGTGGVQL